MVIRNFFGQDVLMVDKADLEVVPAVVQEVEVVSDLEVDLDPEEVNKIT